MTIIFTKIFQKYIRRVPVIPQSVVNGESADLVITIGGTHKLVVIPRMG